MSKYNYDSLALHIHDTPPEIKEAPWWMLHRAIDFYSVQHTRTGEAGHKNTVENLLRILGSITQLSVQVTQPEVVVLPVEETE